MSTQQVCCNVVAALVIAVGAAMFPLATLAQEPSSQSPKTEAPTSSAKPDVPPAKSTSTEETGPVVNNGVYKVGHGVTPPKLIHYVDFKYSKEARKAKLSGVCVVALVVDPQGMPRDIRVTQPLGKGLDENAIKAIQQFRFKPGMFEGKPVPVEIKVEANYKLTEPST